jgi:hypothetical protein
MMKNGHKTDDRGVGLQKPGSDSTPKQDRAARYAAAKELVPQVHQANVASITRARLMMVSQLEAGMLFKKIRELLGPEFSAFVTTQMGPTPHEANVLIRFSEESGIDKDALHAEVKVPRLFELLSLLANAYAEEPVADLPAGSGTSVSVSPAPPAKDHGTQPASSHAADTLPAGRGECAAAQAAAETGGAEEDLDKAFNWIDEFFDEDEAPAACQA